MSWQIIYTKQAEKDAKKLNSSNLKPKAQNLLNIIKDNPYITHPPYEKLIGDLSGVYSRRINIHHRLLYEIYDDKKIMKILRMWTHYE